MKDSELARYRNQLEALRTRLRADAAVVTEQTLAPSGGQAGGAMTNVPMHLADEGTDEFLHDMNAVLAENEEYLVAETQAALGRLDAGDFGRCEGCGQPIAAERLKAMPYARYCVRCAATNGAGVDVNINTGRPQTPRDTLAPEGGMQEDWRRCPSPLTDAAPQNAGAVDIHAAGEAGGGTAAGGLAGSNEGHGDPPISELQEAAGSSEYDVAEGATRSTPKRPGQARGRRGRRHAGAERAK